jgi:hypothetical protein
MRVHRIFLAKIELKELVMDVTLEVLETIECK